MMKKLASFSLLEWARGAFYVLLLTLSFGTRFIIAQGYLGSVPVEWGTVSIFATQILAAIIVALAAAWTLRTGGRSTLLRIPGIPALLLVVVAAIATTWAKDPLYAGVVTSWILLGALLASALRVIRPTLLTSCLAAVAGATIQAAIGLWQAFMQNISASALFGIAPHAPGDLGAFIVETAGGRWLRAYGTLPHPNVLGAVLMVGIVLAFTTADRCSKRVRMALLAVLPVLTAGMFFTYSRGAWLGLIVALIVLLAGHWYRTPDGLHMQEALFLSLAIIFITTAILTAVHHEEVTTRMNAQGRLEQQSLDERKGQYTDAEQLFIEHPLFGIGPGQMPVVLSSRDTSGRTGWDFQPVHNVPALITVELGAVGFLLWLAIVISSFIAARTRGDEADPYRQAFRSIFFGLLVMSLFDHYLWSLWVGQLMFWVGTGMLWALKEYQASPTSRSAGSELK